jgi:hypothetical protein
MFVWTEAKRSSTERDRAAHEAMMKRDLEERARMLLRLGRSPSFVKERLAANLAWDAGHAPTKIPPEVDKIVDAVSRRLRTR